MYAPNIWDKFEAIEIKNDNRVPQEDIDFCATQQTLYTKVMAQHRHIFDSLCQLRDDNEVFLQSVATDNAYKSVGGYSDTYYSCDPVQITKEDFTDKHFDKIQTRFVSAIIKYFSERYHVELTAPDYKALMQIVKPEEPSYNFHFNRTDDENAVFRAEQKRYTEKCDAYLDSIRVCELDYNAILDYVFVELGGNSFGEHSEQEIISGSKSATKCRWGGQRYEIKNKKIAFAILHARKGWDGAYNISLSDSDYRAILRSLTYFDSDKKSREMYARWNQFVSYTKYERDGIFGVHDVYGTKVVSFKYYKNGKFEVTFDSHTSAAAFAETYLYWEGTDDNE